MFNICCIIENNFFNPSYFILIKNKTLQFRDLLREFGAFPLLHLFEAGDLVGGRLGPLSFDTDPLAKCAYFWLG